MYPSLFESHIPYAASPFLWHGGKYQKQFPFTAAGVGVFCLFYQELFSRYLS